MISGILSPTPDPFEDTDNLYATEKNKTASRIQNNCSSALKESTSNFMGQSKTRLRALPMIDHNAQLEKLNSIKTVINEDDVVEVLTSKQSQRRERGHS